MITTTTVFAQAAPPPTGAETAEPAPPATSTQEAPLLQLEAPPERVVAPPVATQEVAPRTPVARPVAPQQLPACEPSATPSPCEQPASCKCSSASSLTGIQSQAADGTLALAWASRRSASRAPAHQTQRALRSRDESSGATIGGSARSGLSESWQSSPRLHRRRFWSTGETRVAIAFIRCPRGWRTQLRCTE